VTKLSLVPLLLMLIMEQAPPIPEGHLALRGPPEETVSYPRGPPEESVPIHHVWGSLEPIHDDSSSGILSGSDVQRFDEALEKLDSVVFHDASEDNTSERSSNNHVDAFGDVVAAPKHPGLQGGYPDESASGSAVLEPADRVPNFAMIELHEAGECKPCLYLNSKSGCLNGDACRFCHLPHGKKNRPRPCKAKRTQCKQIVGMLHTVFGEDSQEFHEASMRLSTESAYMRSILGKSPGMAATPLKGSARGLGRSPAESAELGARFGESALALLSGAAMGPTPDPPAKGVPGLPLDRRSPGAGKGGIRAQF